MSRAVDLTKYLGVKKIQNSPFFSPGQIKFKKTYLNGKKVGNRQMQNIHNAM